LNRSSGAPFTKMKKFLIIVGIFAIVAAIVLVKVAQINKLIHTKPPAQFETVSTTEAKAETWQQTLTSVGSLTAVQGVTVAPELDGKIVELDFEAGASVKAGDVLVRQDTSAEEAQLRSAEANVELARVNLRRTKELLDKATVSQAQFDADSATSKQSEAAADNIRATIAKKTIKAPFSGRLGIRLVNLGQNLKAGDPIVSLQALNPIFVDFYIPQDEMGPLVPGLVVKLSGDGVSGDVEGKITAISPDVDSSTRNLRVEATVDNTAGRLHPGMYVDVAVELPASDKVLTIPATAVLYAPFGDTVYAVDSTTDKDTGETELVVRQQIVRLGARRGDFVVVLSGLKAGDTIVTSGVFRLRPGGTVKVNNSVAPDSQLAPKTNDS
jgi:membrane fusion protein, multidrug efflux system